MDSLHTPAGDEPRLRLDVRASGLIWSIMPSGFEPRGERANQAADLVEGHLDCVRPSPKEVIAGGSILAHRASIA